MNATPYIFIETYFIHPTEKKDPRVKAKHKVSKKSVTIDWDDNLDPYENHRLAAEKLMNKDVSEGKYKLRVYGGSEDGGYIWGYEFVHEEERNNNAYLADLSLIFRIQLCNLLLTIPWPSLEKG